MAAGNETLWHRAAATGDVEAVRDLVRAGTDLDARDRYGQTGLMLAAQHGHREVVALLVASGAALDVTAKYGLTALMLAIVAGHADVARVLVRAGADLAVRGTGAPGFAGQTAYDLARARGMDDLCGELR